MVNLFTPMAGVLNCAKVNIVKNIVFENFSSLLLRMNRRDNLSDGQGL